MNSRGELRNIIATLLFRQRSRYLFQPWIATERSQALYTFGTYGLWKPISSEAMVWFPPVAAFSVAMVAARSSLRETVSAYSMGRLLYSAS